MAIDIKTLSLSVQEKLKSIHRWDVFIDDVNWNLHNSVLDIEDTNDVFDILRWLKEQYDTTTST